MSDTRSITRRRDSAISVRTLSRAAALTGVLAASSWPSMPAAAVERRCTGKLVAGIVEIDGRKGPGAHGLYQDGTTIIRFTGKGECGVINKDDCRRRAKEQIFSCLRSHFSNRTSQGRPWQCNDPDIENYTINDLTKTLIAQACQDLARLGSYPGFHTVNILVVGTTSGDEGCGLEGQTDYISHEQYENVTLGYVEVSCGGKLTPETAPSLGYEAPRTRQPGIELPKK